MLLVFALINRPDIFDLRPGNSFVEYLLDEGYDVFLLDWGVPDDEDADIGLDYYVCDAIPWAMRETLRASRRGRGRRCVGWCIGGTLCAMYCALDPDSPVRNLVLLTTPIDTERLALPVDRPRRLRRRPHRRRLRRRAGRARSTSPTS